MKGGLNTYGYVGGNPISYADPLGLIPPGWYKNIPPGHPWAAGVSITFSDINPFTSGGGGAYGVNLEYTTSTGLHLYRFYTPPKECSAGFEFGVSLSANYATGQGAWTGPFKQVDGNIGPVSFGQFNSVNGSTQNGYYGGQIGIGPSAPYGVGQTETNYKKIL